MAVKQLATIMTMLAILRLIRAMTGALFRAPAPRDSFYRQGACLIRALFAGKPWPRTAAHNG